MASGVKTEGRLAGVIWKMLCHSGAPGIKLIKGSSSVGPSAVCMGTGGSILVDSSFNFGCEACAKFIAGFLLADHISTVQVCDSNSLGLRRSVD